MSTTAKIAAASAVLVAVAALSAGCEDTPVTAPSGSVVNVFANPATVVIDPNVQQPNPDNGRFESQTAITAVFTSSEGRPLQGVSVSFTTTAGALASAGNAVKTDSTGTARDTLTVNDQDPNEITVAASSSAVGGSLTITKTLIGENELPRASVVFSPRNDDNMDLIPDGPQNTVITFDGSSSIDPDGVITCFQWEIGSDNPDIGRANPMIEQGPGVSGLNLQFANLQTLAVTLRVSDKPETGALCVPGGTPVPGTLPDGTSAFSPLASFNQYQILCKNTPPTARIVGEDTGISAPGSPSTLTPVVLDGRPSSDPETAIDQYLWTCGNDQSPVPQSADGSQVICRYRAQSTPYTATLVVKDRGTGSIDPGTGTYRCQKSSEAATIQVSVTFNTQ